MDKKYQFILKKNDLKKFTFSNNKLITIKKSLKIVSKCTYSVPAYDYRNTALKELETNNIFKFVNNYMYGYCHEICFFFKYLLKINKIKSRIIRLKSKRYPINHWVVECMYQRKWILIDPTLGIYFKDRSNENYLSLEEIKKINKNKILTNKKISLKKFSTLNKKNYFYFKNKKSFLNTKDKYYSYFDFLEYPKINDNKYDYKKKLINKYNLKDFMTYKAINFNFNQCRIERSNLNYGIQNGKKVKSNKFIIFQNFILKKKINKKTIKIKNFPFPILDVKLISKNIKNTLYIKLNADKFKIKYKTKNWLLEKNIKKNIFLNSIRNIKIKSAFIINSYEILFLRSNKII